MNNDELAELANDFLTVSNLVTEKFNYYSERAVEDENISSTGMKMLNIAHSNYGEAQYSDICKRINISRPLVNLEAKQLRGDGYITIESNGIDSNKVIRLTPQSNAVIKKYSEVVSEKIRDATLGLSDSDLTMLKVYVNQIAKNINSKY